MKKFAAIVIALSLTALSACGVSASPVSTPGPAETAESESTPRSVIGFEILTEAVKCGTGDLYTYTYPRLKVDTGTKTGSVLTEELNAALTPAEDTLSDVDAAARDAYGALDEAGKLDWMGVGYGFDRKAELMRCDGRVLSLLVSDSRSLGAPHPSNSGFGLTCDLEDGRRLSVADIAEEPDALRKEVEDYILDSAMENVGAPTFYGLSGFAAGVLDSGQWYLSGGGLVAFAAPEEIAPYAVGSVVFDIPYSELEGLIKPEYLPQASPESGAGTLKISAGSSGAACSAVLDEGGVEFSLTASQEVRDICIHRVSMDTDGSFYPQELVLYVSRLGGGESLGLTAAFMDSPLYSVSWGEGEARLIADSGKDGSLLLLEP